MGSLENIIDLTDIAAAISFQKQIFFKKEESLSDIIKEQPKKEEDISDIKSKVKEDIFDFIPKSDTKQESVSYSPFKMFSEYLSKAKSTLYGYYKAVKKSFKEIMGKVGYTDKTIREIEDWGNIYFKTAFKNLMRLSPLGSMHRYMQSLWIYVGKHVK